MLNDTQWNKLSNYCRSKLASLFDPATPFASEKGLRTELNSPHKGFYIGIVDASGEELVRSGFLRGSQNIHDSADIATQNAHEDLKSAGVSASKIQSGSFFFTLVTDVSYMQDPMRWSDEIDGVYFMWGQKYRSLYLPYQIKRMGVPKTEVLDRLCSLEAGVASNLWRLPEGLCFKIACQSYTA